MANALRGLAKAGEPLGERSIRFVLVACLAAGVLNAQAIGARTSRTTTSSQLPRRAAEGLSGLAWLPASLQPEGRAILDERDEKRRAKLAGGLAEEHPAESTRFLIALAD